MQVSGLERFEPVLLVLLLTVAALAIVAKRLQIAYPIVMVMGGLGLSLLPQIPRVSLEPDVVFLVILPPLLFSAAFHTSWREFRANIASIFMLAFGLVGFTIFGVAAATRFFLPGFDWRLGLVLGSVVAATDAIAATAIAKRLGLPRRITELLEAESLVNDGSGLVALRFTLAMVVSGTVPSFALGVWTLFYLISAAVLIGLGVGMLVHFFQKRIVDSPIEITISLVTPYIAYLLAERMHCSGVLATLACGIYIGRRSSGFFSLHARIEGSAVWQTLDFILNGVVFLVLGLQLPTILAGIHELTPASLLVAGTLFSGIVILLRMLWVFPGAWISNHIQRRLPSPHAHLPLSRRSIFLLGWAGMRGVLALAAALSLPERLDDGAPFPQRNMILFLAFCAIFSTLVLQGLSMPVLIRRLGLARSSANEEEEHAARKEMTIAALQTIRDESETAPVDHYAPMEGYYRRRLALVESGSGAEHAVAAWNAEQVRVVAQKLRNVERSVVSRLKAENKIHDEVARTLEYELDLLDARDVGLRS
jgi:monovalent cation/hydrogen antiporter